MSHHPLLTRWMARPWFFTLWCVLAAFGAYACMYGFRKPFTAAGFGGAETKAWLVTAQVIGYMLSKFIGIKVIAEMTTTSRARVFLGLVAIAHLVLLLFAIVPAPLDAVCLFLNGLALGMVFAAYASEAFVGAIRAIGKGQFEAGDALGMRRATTWFVVVLPQLIRLALPAIGNLWLVLLKDTSLVSVIALNDLLRMTNIAVGATKQPFFFYLVALLIYLALSIISSIGLSKLETRFGRGYGAAR
jgi:ABC-type arginine transport system permease subunit